jgi:hypothetical protein
VWFDKKMTHRGGCDGLKFEETVLLVTTQCFKPAHILQMMVSTDGWLALHKTVWEILPWDTVLQGLVLILYILVFGTQDALLVTLSTK